MLNDRRKRLTTRALAASAAILVFPPAARAQTASDSSAAAVTADSSNSADIVVTANKRSETVQSVAGTVNVVPGAQLVDEGKSRLADYISKVPGVSINTLGGTPGQSILTIRGIPPLSAGSKVATYIDETPLGSSGIWAQASVLTLDLLPFDLDRIELLSGPQGTLYGASSMGGLLKYVLTTPDTHKLSGVIGVSATAVTHAGKLGTTEQAHINIPLVADKLAISGSAFYVYNPGFVDNARDGAKDTNSNKQFGGRIALFAQPATNLTIKLNALWQNNNSRDFALFSVLNPTISPATATSVRTVSAGTEVGRLAQYRYTLEPFKNSIAFYSGTLNWDIGVANLTSATSWSRTTDSRTLDKTASYGSLLPLFGASAAGISTLNIDLETRKFTQEVRLTSPSDLFLTWQVGAFYTHEDQRNVQTIPATTFDGIPIPALQPFFGYATIPTSYKELAGFGSIGLKFSNRFDISGGLRYSTNDQVFTSSAQGILLGLPQTPLTNTPTVKSSEDNTTWMVNARYHFDRDVMLYARIATGYSPGGANTPQPGLPQATVESERLTSYEVGIKSQFVDRKILLNVTGYHIDWSNIQLAATNGLVSYTTNGGHAVSNGVELTTRVLPAQGLALGLNGSYTDAKVTSLNPNVLLPFVLDRQLQYVPRWTASASIDYDWNAGNDWKAHVGADLRWTDKQAATQPTYGQAFISLPAYAAGNLLASVSKDGLSFRLFVNNIMDSRGISYATPQSGISGITQIDYAVMQPRTFGFGATKRF